MWLAIRSLVLLILSLNKFSAGNICKDPFNEFYCGDDDQCISYGWVCDGVKECKNGNDEKDCKGCKGFKCENNECILAEYHCNGREECSDGSDEKSCLTGDTCESRNCSHFCRSTPAGTECFCRDGYELDTNDNETCNSAEPLLFISTLKDIRVLNLKFRKQFSVLRTKIPAYTVDINQRNGRIYWIESNSSESSIYSSEKDGSDFKTVLSHGSLGLLIPRDIAVDYVANNIYVTDSALKQVLACRMEGYVCHVLHDKSVEKPYSIELDLKKRTMYWSDFGERGRGIYRSGMDGSEQIRFVTKDVKLPTGIAIDNTLDRLYWADAGYGIIQYITLDRMHTEVVQQFFVYQPVSLAVSQESIYWVDKKTNTVESCTKSNCVKFTLMENDRLSTITGLQVYQPVLAVKAENPCKSSDCQHMCLLSPIKDFVCVCSRGFTLAADQKTCIVKQCNINEFKCQNGTCLRLNQKCDGIKDCEDGADEANCRDPCKNMTCSQYCNKTLSPPQCTCKGGFALDFKDNRTCIDIDECQQDGFCSQRCRNTQGGYECRCDVGYELVSRTCKAKGPDALLFFSTNHEIHVEEINSKRLINSMTTSGRAATFDFHPKNLNIYWVEMLNNESVIKTENERGTSMIIMRHEGLFEDIAVDYIANNLYITEMKFKEVLVCRIDGSMCHVFNDIKIGEPHSIALDLHSRLMYWSNWDKRFAGIYRSGMDGLGRISFVRSDDIIKPYSITLDRYAERLFWADASLNTIQFITFDKSLRKMILKSNEYRPYAVAVFEDNIYWSDRSTFLVNSCNKFSGRNVTTVMQNTYLVRKLRVHHPSLLSEASNPCNNVCSHMCLISPHYGYVCVCPIGFKLSQDRKTCLYDSSCKPGEMWCSPKKECIPEEQICDGEYDCIDRSDEKGCKTSTVSSNPSPVISGEKDNELIFTAEGPNIYVGVRNATRYDFKLRPSSLASNAMITSLSYDSKSQTLFVSEANRPAIFALSAFSSGVRELVVNNIISPKDIDFDWLSNNLYWVDSRKGTVEVISVNNLKSVKRIVLLKGLAIPVSIALSPNNGNMFVSTIGDENCITVYGMDGKGKRILHSVQGVPMSLTLHPSKTILYWTDSRAGMIMYVNYTGSSSPWILKSGINGVMSVDVSENNVYWTARELTNPVVAAKIFMNPLSDQTDQTAWKSIALSRKPFSGKSECLTENNGGCSYLCLTSQTGRTCSCSSTMSLAKDGRTCLGKRCEKADFSCSDGQCISSERKCDGSIDCNDGSDESNCTKRNSKVEPFQ